MSGNILSVESELLVNASNGIGWMGGFIGRWIPLSGVAESIHYKDNTIERHAKKEARRLKAKSGDIFHTTAGTLPFPKGILHAVTMKLPGQFSRIHFVESCLKNIVEYCEENAIKTVAIPLLGTGTGRLKELDILQLYEVILSSSNTQFLVIHYVK